jgi:hypothetical protein
MMCLYKGKSESKYRCILPMNRTIIASCYFVMPWYVVPLLDGRYLDQCRKCSVSWKLVTLLNKLTKKDVCTVIQLFQVQNLEPTNNHRQVVTICGVSAMSFQQGQKFCL